MNRLKKTLLPIKQFFPDPTLPTQLSRTHFYSWFFLFPLFIAFFVELIQRDNFLGFFAWQNDYGLTSFYLSYLIVLLTFALIYALTSRLGTTSLLIAIFYMGLGLINFFKFNLRGEPFLPWDVFLKNEALNVLSDIEVNLPTTFVGLLILLLLLSLMPFLVKEPRFSIKSRIILFASCGILLGFCFSQVIFNQDTLTSLGIEDLRWNQTINYDHNGFLIAFMNNMKYIMIDKPEDYNAETIEALLSEFDFQANTLVDSNALQTPNIIFIMSESFFDPTQLPNVSFSADPLPTVNQIRQEGVSGNLLVSEFGGGTANTEFEVLTGHKTSFLPSGSMAYQQYIKEETAALPAYLKNDGYTTMAVHSYEKWFWNRNDVYPLIGFDSFDADIDFPDSEYRGNYISDQVAVEKVVTNFENHRAQSSDPAFCFLVTMQNHGSYDNKNFPAFDVTVDAPDLSSQNQLLLQNYVQGVYDADAALGQLIDYFKSNQEPTIIVMFGDHLPTLGEDYEIYRQLGFASEGQLTDADYNNLYTTPFVIWNNYDLSPSNWGTLDANLLGAAVLEDAQMNLPLYWKILLEQRENRANQNKFALFTADIIDTDRVIAETNAFNAKHWLLEYDLLFGNDYSNAFDHDILQTAIDQ
ncbi:MAG: hypothetical protein PWP56_590 [Acetobacterium sp.]|jgi:Phosphoglycerol transferase and related proteins, alkaline phosphatase superfamily|nr:hypothetical protein [Acetobacterium sp.]